MPGLKLGASVAINGVCLTVAAMQGSVAEFDAVAETLQRSNLGRLTAGSKVNLERSLRVGEPLDGHFVQGHVDGVAAVQRLDVSPGEWKVWFTAAPDVMRYVVPKGSVAIDGRQAQADGARLRWFIVVPVFQGLGIGKELISRAVEFCKHRRYPKVYLWTFEGLDTARSIYEKHNFRLCEENKIDQWGQHIKEQKFELVL